MTFLVQPGIRNARKILLSDLLIFLKSKISSDWIFFNASIKQNAIQNHKKTILLMLIKNENGN
jgi:hypothetical protein